MAFIIPTSSDEPLYTEGVNLDGVDYIFKFALNSRDSSWYMSVYDAEESPIVLSVRLVPDWPLLRRQGQCAPSKPPGILLLIDTTGANDDCGPTDLGTRFLLVYTTQAEINAFNASLPA